jgi:GNAT superfamily N-acetyltransferase
MRGPIAIRPATPADRAWILPLSSRLHDFGPPPWRSRERMDAAVALAIGAALDAGGLDSAVFVAQDGRGNPLGFVHVHTATDFFTGEDHGHVSDIVVAPGAEGGGVGRALMAAGEAWSRDRGHRLLTLNVFGGNSRARRLYELLGYSADTTKLVKILRD